MTQTAGPPVARTRVAVARGVPPDPARFPATGVVGEVKPHTPEGIRGGLDQLRRRLAAAARTRTPGPPGPRGAGAPAPQLVTYRRSPSDPTRFDVRIADPPALRRALRGGGGLAETDFLPVGTVVYPGAARPIPLWQCPTRLGVRMEPKVRFLYAQWMREVQRQPGVRVARRPPQRGGADIEHERDEFLAELDAALSRHRPS